MESVFNNGGVIGKRSVYSPAAAASIVSDNLILHLDAVDTNSYSGSGTTWTDISGNGNDFTLDNASAFVSGSPNYMDFNGSYGAAQNSSDLALSGDITYVLATRIKESNSDWRTLTRGFGGDHHVIIQDGGYEIGMYDNDGAGFMGSGYNQTQLPSYGTSDWIIMYFRWSGSSPYYELSYNDSPETIRGSITNSSSQYNRGFGYLGSYQGSRQFWGDISTFLVYDRYLSDAELQQNYDFLASQIGL